MSKKGTSEMSSRLADKKIVKKQKKHLVERKAPKNETVVTVSSKKKKKEVKEVKEVEMPVKKIKTPSSEGKKPGNEIDDIFAGRKKRKKELEEEEKQKQDSIERLAKIRKRNKSKVPDGDGFADPPPRPRRKTGDGLTIYTEEELANSNLEIGGSGSCPFDCACCF